MVNETSNITKFKELTSTGKRQKLNKYNFIQVIIQSDTFYKEKN